MTGVEKRKNLRRSISYPAMIDIGDGSPLRECSLCDASQEGAQLTVADTASLPDQFMMVLSFDGAARRRCRVVWKNERQVGIEFVKEAKPEKRVRDMMRFAFPDPTALGASEGEGGEDRPPVETLPPR
jgi:hypothetical protein